MHLPRCFSPNAGPCLPRSPESPPLPSSRPAGRQLPLGLPLRWLRHSVPRAVPSALHCSLQPVLTCLRAESSVRISSVGRFRGPENPRKGYTYCWASSYFSPNCCREATPGPSPPPGEPRGPARTTATHGPADSVRAVSELRFCPVGSSLVRGVPPGRPLWVATTACALLCELSLGFLARGHKGRQTSSLFTSSQLRVCRQGRAPRLRPP